MGYTHRFHVTRHLFQQRPAGAGAPAELEVRLIGRSGSFFLLIQVWHGEAEEGGDTRQLPQLLPRQMQAGEDSASQAVCVTRGRVRRVSGEPVEGTKPGAGGGSR